MTDGRRVGFLLNNFIGMTRQLNPQLLAAALLVDGVLRDMQSLVPQAVQAGSVTVSETRIQQWQTSLQNAASLLRQLPAPLIFPPPEFVTLANAAASLIDQVLTTLAAIPIASLAIFPPQPGQGTISSGTLLGMISNLQQAEALLLRALQVA